MAETVYMRDIEQAEGHRSSSIHHDKQGHFPDIEAETTFQDMKRIETQKVIVLSFRSLQLRRIAELQDELFRLAVKTADIPNLPETHNSDVDNALHAYGEYCTVNLSGIMMYIFLLTTYD
jgi:hypothetical protein